MADENLSPDEREAVLELLRDTNRRRQIPVEPAYPHPEIGGREARPGAAGDGRAVPAGESMGQQQRRAAEGPMAALT
jgi:hypothetical protein